MLMYACVLKFSMYVYCVFDFIVLLPIGVIKNIYYKIALSWCHTAATPLVNQSINQLINTKELTLNRGQHCTR